MTKATSAPTFSNSVTPLITINRMDSFQWLVLYCVHVSFLSSVTFNDFLSILRLIFCLRRRSPPWKGPTRGRSSPRLITSKAKLRENKAKRRGRYVFYWVGPAGDISLVTTLFASDLPYEPSLSFSALSRKLTYKYHNLPFYDPTIKVLARPRPFINRQTANPLRKPPSHRANISPLEYPR